MVTFKSSAEEEATEEEPVREAECDGEEAKRRSVPGRELSA